MKKIHKQDDDKNIGHSCILADIWKTHLVLSKSEPRIIICYELNYTPPVAICWRPNLSYFRMCPFVETQIQLDKLRWDH